MEFVNKESSEYANFCVANVDQQNFIEPNKIHINHDECFNSLMSVDNGRGELMLPNIGNDTIIPNNNNANTADSILPNIGNATIIAHNNNTNTADSILPNIGNATIIANNNNINPADSMLQLAMEDLLQCEENLDILQLQNETFGQQNTTLSFPPLMNCKQSACAIENSNEMFPATTTMSGIFPISSMPATMASNQIKYNQQIHINELRRTTATTTAAAAATTSTTTNNVNTIVHQYNALEKLAYNIWQLSQEDHIVIDKRRNEVIRTNAHTNQKTIYRLTDPISMGMKPMSESTSTPINDMPTKSKAKVGRPRKRVPAGAKPNEDNSKLSKVSTNQQIVEPEATMPQVPEIRTRFGRIVRSSTQNMSTNLSLSKQSQRNNKANTSTSTIPSIYQMDSAGNTMTPETIVNSLNELLDKDYRPSYSGSRKNKKELLPSNQMDLTNQSELGSRLDTNPNDDSNKETVPTKRFVPPQSICPTCNKVFLGKRLERHFVKNPHHMRQPEPERVEIPNTCMQQNNNENMSLFNFLIAKIQNSQSELNEDQRADLFLNELNDFIVQLQLRCTRLIRNTSGMHFVNARTSRVLGIPEGQYALDMNAIEMEPENINLMLYDSTQTMPSVATRNLIDYTTALSMSIDNTLTDEAAQKLNLSAGGKLLPPSEESLLRTVDDFSHMQTNGVITKLRSVGLQIQPPVVVMNNVHDNDNIENVNELANSGLIDDGSVVIPDNCSSSSGGVGSGGSGGLNTCVSTVNDNVVNGGNSNSEDMGVGALLSQYVHVSDNAVEAMNMTETTNSTMLDLNVDFFQFNNT